jgi:DNA invertase Pin-like site-specific DNA recombinase
MAAEIIPAVQYVRMSTEHQQYSLTNQAATVQRYAEGHGFLIVKTYFDHGRSGLQLKYRYGLQQLLRDVVSEEPGFLAILVYDVSRWGRFQDSDESAHYEFICKQAGIPVIYCAEPFENDGAMPSMIMKWLKRTMASEYSRELSHKVYMGHIRMARLGFKQGGGPGFGLRRMLISPDGQYKQILRKGERKSIATDRVILVPGPEYEVKWVRKIYKMLNEEQRSAHWITVALNRLKVQRPDNEYPWRYGTVVNILTNPKYAGCNAYGRSTQKLGTAVRKVPQSEWILTPGAYTPVVSRETFDKAQDTLRNRIRCTPKEELLESLRKLWAREGRLSQKVIEAAADFPVSCSCLRYRFGSVRNAFEAAGYGHPEHYGRVDERRRSLALRNQLLRQLQERFPGELTVMQKHPLSRIRLKLRSGLLICVCMSRSRRLRSGVLRWYMNPLAKERRLITLLVRLDTQNEHIEDMYIIPSVNRLRLFWIKFDDQWLTRGKRLEDISQFLRVVEEVWTARRLMNLKA